MSIRNICSDQVIFVKYRDIRYHILILLFRIGNKFVNYYKNYCKYRLSLVKYTKRYLRVIIENLTAFCVTALIKFPNDSAYHIQFNILSMLPNVCFVITDYAFCKLPDYLLLKAYWRKSYECLHFREDP